MVERKSKYMRIEEACTRLGCGRKKMRKIAEIKYSDILQFYRYLVEEVGLSVSTLESVHTVLHPTFALAVRDDIIRNNPTDGVMAEIKKKINKKAARLQCN